ncbi:PhnD/SsuA/transferrin family substrate-binding protein [Roseofilum sp. Belize Diploria]|uniref:PhnD/SsuA/transferrin family substrate-binding protein n=2 Tax=Roseofilum TaxID=1233426 RepID=UPI001B289B8A|nr:PhnD/SsuA/transferrin family substrate-binding protein [Roseofilum sp. Belize Diploria]MBP0011123.1 PhnD/SsuA/transferrin family substrate-binding protein [Roseofilum sp. Belize Diploria]
MFFIRNRVNRMSIWAIAYVGSHDKNTTALVQGKVDAIAIEEKIYQKAIESGELSSDRYTILWQSDPLPNSPLVIRSTLPDKFKLKVRKALIEAPPGLGLVGGDRASGYTSVQDEDYEPIRRIQETLGLDNWNPYISMVLALIGNNLVF